MKFFPSFSFLSSFSSFFALIFFYFLLYSPSYDGSGRNNVRLDLYVDKETCDLTCVWTKWLVTWLGLARKWLVTWLGLARKWLVTWFGLAKHDLLPSLHKACLLHIGLLVYWGLTPQQQPGSYQGSEMMMMKSVIWWRKPEYPEETTVLQHAYCTTKTKWNWSLDCKHTTRSSNRWCRDRIFVTFKVPKMNLGVSCQRGWTSGSAKYHYYHWHWGRRWCPPKLTYNPTTAAQRAANATDDDDNDDDGFTPCRQLRPSSGREHKMIKDITYSVWWWWLGAYTVYLMNETRPVPVFGAIWCHMYTVPAAITDVLQALLARFTKHS